MRFRYFDSEGTEIGVASVDALRFRIQKGAVTPETLLYDAAAGQWAPARQNALFRFLVEEEDLLPPEMRSLMDPDTSATDSGSPGPSDSPVSWRESGGRFESVDLDEALDVELPDGEGVSHGASRSSTDASTADDPGQGADAEAVGSDAANEADEVEVDDDADAADEARPADPDGFPDLELRMPENGWGAGAGGRDDSGAPPAHGGAAGEMVPGGVAGRPGSDTGAARSSGGGVPGAPGRARAHGRDRSGRRVGRWSSPRKARSVPVPGSRRRRRGPPSLGGVVVLSLLVFLVVSVPLLVFGGDGGNGEDGVGGDGAGEEGSAYALVGALADDLMGEGRAAGSSVADGGPVGGGAPAPPSSESATGVGTVENPSPAVDDAALDELIAGLAAASSEDLDAAMVRLRDSLGVPESPPEIWLRGRYLAAADSFPEVKAYWEALASYVSSMEELEEDLFRGYVRDRVRSLDMDPAPASRLTSRILDRYRDTAAGREAVYRDLSALTLQALTLHDTLAARSRDISYEPFDGTGLSRDPVIEAVAEDEALGERIWSRLDRVLDLLESLQGLRPVTTSQLQAALLRAPGVEPSFTNPPALPSATNLRVPTEDAPDLDG